MRVGKAEREGDNGYQAKKKVSGMDECAWATGFAI